ncbi:GUN4 domain-containing protein [Leptothoe sp. PORK10 BA2]|uniref:GUN4 domain-containing protein n=1 Tax=Leptothoe sp. PORK10 BA2 TaxID=3110254 RepID=UPI002B1FC9F2|nr:GUN4 domain-containing protein [Leptothoe sp. PORK10 BA2]MEA5464981.1 GUN4 domain-containing protein [Leptothoe sp. PORK10 BA2]
MTEAIKKSIVRLRNKSEKYIGAGTLVSCKHVLTCAHVVADALGLPRTVQEKPEEQVTLDFPFIASGKIITAKVVFWLPVQLHQSEFLPEDIALLELDELAPEQAKPSKFGVVTVKKSDWTDGGHIDSPSSRYEWDEHYIPTASDLEGHSFEVCGFPAGNLHGVWAKGILTKETANGWIQIEATGQEGYQIEPGFSGAPIWDKELQGVVGLTVSTDPRRPQVRVGFIIPTQVLYKAYPKLDGIDLEARKELLSETAEKYEKLFSEVFPSELPFRLDDKAEATLRPLRNEIEELLKQDDLKHLEYSLSPERIENPVISKRLRKYSDVGIDYSVLSFLLETNRWKDADIETLRIIVEIILRLQMSSDNYHQPTLEKSMKKRLQSGEIFNAEEINNLPCKDLNTIDKLWTENSQGKFGFSVQKDLWTHINQESNFTNEAFRKFGERVGWCKPQKIEERVVALAEGVKRFLSFKLRGEKKVSIEQDEITLGGWLSYEKIASAQTPLPGCFPLKASVGVGINFSLASLGDTGFVVYTTNFDTKWYGGKVRSQRWQLFGTGRSGSSYLKDIFMRLNACSR